MSDHLDSPDPQTDICDLYVFAKPGSPSNTILVMNVNPEAPKHASRFDPQASYEWKIDTNGDLFADLAYHVSFSKPTNGEQFATLYRATGPDAERSGPAGSVVIPSSPVCFGQQVHITEAGDYRFYAGIRSDPFFLDLDGYLNKFQWTGQNVNAANNVFSIVLELPNSEFSNSQYVGVWVRTLAPMHGELHQMDQAGRPGTSPLFFMGQEQQQALFNGSHPSRHIDQFQKRLMEVFQERYSFNIEEALAESLKWLPDILPFEPGCVETYPNGRWLNDDTLAVAGLAWTHGKCGPSLSKGNLNLLPDFPYLGDPHSAR